MDRRLGLAGGFLVGDALGAPFNAVKAGHVRQLVDGWADGFLAKPVLFPDRPDKNALPGLHTVHGQQFLALLSAAGTEETGQHPVARAATSLRELAGTEEARHSCLGALRAPGRPLRRAIARWQEEYPWEPEDHFARDEESEGAAPAAMALATVLTEGAEPLHAVRLTHLRENALVAATTIAEAAAMLLALDAPKRIEPRSFLDALVAHARKTEDALRDGEEGARWRELAWGVPPQRFSACLSPVASLLETGDDALAEQTLVRQAAEFSPAQAVSHVQHGFAPILVPWVLYRALGPMPLARAVEDAINRGGEASLAAGLIGGLLGARHGVGSVPPEWLEDCRAWSLAQQATKMRTLAVEEAWAQAEREWTGEQERLREPLRVALESRRADAPPPKKKKSKPQPEAPVLDQGKLPFAPPPQVWLQEKGDELAPWEKQRLKSERGRKRIDWKEDRRKKQAHDAAPDSNDDRDDE